MKSATIGNDERQISTRRANTAEIQQFFSNGQQKNAFEISTSRTKDVKVAEIDFAGVCPFG